MECIPRSPLPLPALASLLARAETKVKNDGRKRERERERESVDGLRRGEGDREGGKRKSYPPLFFLLAVSAVGKKKYGADRRGGREDEEAAGSGKMRKGGGGGGFSFSFFSPGFPLGRRRGPPPLYPIFLLVSKCVASCTSFPPSSINYLAHSLFSNPASFFFSGRRSEKPRRTWTEGVARMARVRDEKASTESAFDWRVYLTFLFIFFARKGAEAPRRRPS